MKTPLLFALCALILSSCSYKINRTGYTVNKSNYSGDCNIVIKKNADIDDSMQKVGEIRLKDSGFTTSCSEETAMELLRKEGCALNANLINITNESRIDILSSCYRCTAEFYKVSDGSILATDGQFSTDNVEARLQKDRKKTAGILIGSILAGIVLGIVIALSGQ